MKKNDEMFLQFDFRVRIFSFNYPSHALIHASSKKREQVEVFMIISLIATT